MKEVMCIYGTRPEAIKMAPLIAAMRDSSILRPIPVATGQHREMLDQVHEVFGISPAHDFDVMSHGASLEELSASVLAATGSLLRDSRPEAVVVQGDTSSAFFAALSAFYQGIPVFHLEAGLRTRDIRDPFPEEANRRLIAPLASLHLAPTAHARNNLSEEGVPTPDICVTGNTVIDALAIATQRVVPFTDPRVQEAVQGDGRIVLVTTHRRESWGPRMQEVVGGLHDIAKMNDDVTIILPMHRNQVVRRAIEPVLGGVRNVVLTEPMTYGEFSHLLANAYLVLTDSGGIQEEAPSLGKPVLVLRDTTERPEAVDAGTVKLVGTNRDIIAKETANLLENSAAYSSMATAVNPYGDGHASARAVAAIASYFALGERLPDFNPAASSEALGAHESRP